MPPFTFEGPNIDPTEIESEKSMSALGEALDTLGIQGEAAGGVECDVLGDGDISVRTPMGTFTIHEVVETIARIRVGPATRVSTPPLLASAPTRSSWGCPRARSTRRTRPPRWRRRSAPSRARPSSPRSTAAPPRCATPRTATPPAPPRSTS